MAAALLLLRHPPSGGCRSNSVWITRDCFVAGGGWHTRISYNIRIIVRDEIVTVKKFRLKSKNLPSNMFSKNFFNKQQSILVALAAFVSIAAVAVFAYGATTIGTNVSIDGNLTVSGSAATSTFSTGGFTVGTDQFVVQQTSGRVGIGTTSPSAVLSLAGNAYFDSALFVFGSSTASTLQFAFQRAATTTIPQTSNAWSIATSTTAIPILSLDGKNGRIAIGAADPDKIDPSNTSSLLATYNEGSTFTDISFRESSNFQFGAIFLNFLRSKGTLNTPTANQNGDLLGAITFQGHDGTNFQNGSQIRSSVDGTISAGNVPSNLTFGTTLTDAFATERMRITSTGNVGIGTTTPYSRFHVSRGASATTTVNFGEVGSATSKACFNTKNTSGADISFYFNAANALVIESNLCR